jgi:hypothetical protein
VLIMRFASLLLAGAVAACGSPETQRTRALMEAPIVPASDAIFGAVIYTNGQLATAPSSDAEWDRLRQHARRMIAAAAELMTLAPQNDPGEWRRQTDALAKASTAALMAMETKSLEGVLDAGSRIYETCTACHATYLKQP